MSRTLQTCYKQRLVLRGVMIVKSYYIECVCLRVDLKAGPPVYLKQMTGRGISGPAKQLGMMRFRPKYVTGSRSSKSADEGSRGVISGSTNDRWWWYLNCLSWTLRCRAIWTITRFDNLYTAIYARCLALENVLDESR